MKRSNYRVLSYYKDDETSTECYISIINATSRTEIESYYYNCTDLDYEILSETECKSKRDFQNAGSILFEGERFYNIEGPDTFYENLLDLLYHTYGITAND